MKHWINSAKFIAITAVVIDHSNGFLYYNHPSLLNLTFFSVSLFIFLSGITSYYSSKKHNDSSYFKECYRRISKIIIPYAIAVFIYMLYTDHTIDIYQWLTNLIQFNYRSLFYFVLVFIQLLLISPFLYKLIIHNNKKYSFFKNAITIILLLFISLFFTLSTNFNSIIGPVHFLGGTYIILFFLGMLFANYEENIQSFLTHKYFKSITLITSFSIFIGIYLIYLRNFKLVDLIRSTPTGLRRLVESLNLQPPSLLLIVYAISCATIIYLIFNKFEILNKIFSKLGAYSYFIYLFHLLILDILLKFSNPLLNNIWLNRAIFLTCMIFIPICIGIVYQKLSIYFKRIMHANS